MPLKPTKRTKRKTAKKRTRVKREKYTLVGFRKLVWVACSRYVRLRDCLRTTGTREWGRCVTCGKLLNFKKLQAGHFTCGRADAVLFETNGIRAQCYRCNVERSGEWPTFYRIMQAEFGQEEIERLVTLSLSDVKLTRVQLRDLYIKFKTGIKEFGELTL